MKKSFIILISMTMALFFYQNCSEAEFSQQSNKFSGTNEEVISVDPIVDSEVPAVSSLRLVKHTESDECEGPECSASSKAVNTSTAHKTSFVCVVNANNRLNRVATEADLAGRVIVKTACMAQSSCEGAVRGTYPSAEAVYQRYCDKNSKYQSGAVAHLDEAEVRALFK